MSGYRQSSFDPNAGGDYGPPLRPFNKVQWAGAAFVTLGIAVMLATIAGNLGWISGSRDWLPVGTSFCALGTILINTRRKTLTPEQTEAQRRRGMIAVAIAFAVCAIVAMAIIYFKGA
jgi:hydrogenase-4 membrane subunit HyfE